MQEQELEEKVSFVEYPEQYSHCLISGFILWLISIILEYLLNVHNNQLSGHSTLAHARTGTVREKYIFKYSGHYSHYITFWLISFCEWYSQ